MSVQFDFTKLEESIDKATIAIEQLDNRLAKTAKTTTAFNRLFGNTKQFNDFVSTLNRLGYLSANNFKVVAQGLTDIANALDRLKTSDVNFGGFIRNINTLLTSVSLLGNVKAVPNFAPALISIITPIAEFAKTSSSIGSFSSLTKSLQGISTFLSALNNLTITNFKKDSLISKIPVIGKYLDPSKIQILGRTLKQFTDALKGVQFPQNLGATFTGLGRFLNSFNNLDITNLTKPSKLSRLTSGDSVFSILGSFFAKTNLQKLGKSLSDFSKNFKNIKIPDNVGSAFDGIGNLIRSINKLNFGEVQTNKAQRLPLIGVVFQKIADVFKPSKFKLVANALKLVIEVFKPFKNAKLPDFSGILNSLLEFAKTLSVDGFGKADTKAFLTFTETIAKGLKNLSDSDINPKKLQAIGASLTGLKDAASINIAVNQGASGVADVLQNAAGQFIGQVAFSVLEKVQGFIGKLLNFSGAIRDALQGVGQAVSGFGNTLTTAGQSLLQNFGLQGLANNPLAKVAADFDHLSNAVKVFGNLTADELKQAQSFADEIGIKYPLSANDALQATLDLIKAGQDLNSIHFILPAAADLATLGDETLPNTTQALIQATNVFDRFTKDTEANFDNVATAANLFSASADVSTATVSELIQGLQNVGPSANQAGLDLQQTLAILTQFNDAGIRGAEAGTQLRQVLRTIHAPQAANELAAVQLLLKQTGSDIDLSLSNADGSLRDFNEVVDSLSKAYKVLGFNQTQLLDSISKIAGAKSSQGLAVLLKNGGFQGVIDQLNSMDSASIRSGQLLDDFQGDVTQLQGSLETLGKDGFLPLIQNSFRPFVKLGRTIVDSLLTLSPAVYEVASNILLLGSSVATLVGGLAIGIGTILKFEGALFSLSSTVLGLITNLPGLIVGITGFVGALGTFLVTATAIGVAVGTAALVFTEFRHVITENIGGAGGAFDQFRASVEYTISRIGPLFEQVGRVLNLVFGDKIQGEVDGFGKRVANFFNRLTIGSFQLDQVVEQIGALFENFGNFVEEGFGKSTPETIAFFQDQLEKLSTFPLIKTLFGNRATPTGLRKIFSDTTQFLKRIVDSVDDLVSGGIGILFGEKDALARAEKGLAGLFSTLAGLIQNVTGLDLGKTILDFDSGKIGEGVTDFFKVVLQKVRDWFVQNRAAIIGVVGDVLSFGTQAAFGGASFLLRVLGLDSAADAVQNIGNTLSDIIHRGVEFAIRLFAGENVVDFSGAKRLLDAFLADPQGIADDLASRLSDIVSSAIGKIPDLIKGIGQTLNIQALIDLGDTLSTSDFFQGIADTLGVIAGYPLTAIGDVFDGIKAIFDAATSGNTDGVVAVLTALGVVAASSGALTLLFSGLKSVLFGAIIPAVGIVTLVSALGNLRDLLKTGDVGTFLKNTLADIASTLASFIGIDLGGREGVIDKVTAALESARDTFPALIKAVGDQIGLALDNIFKDILSRIVIFIDGAQASLGISGASGAAFTAARDAIAAPSDSGGKNDLGVFSALGNPNLSDTDAEALARTSSDRIINALGRTLDLNPDVNTIPDALFGNIARSLTNAGLVDRAVQSIDPGPTRDAFLARIQKSINDAAPIPVTIKIDPTLSPSDASNYAIQHSKTASELVAMMNQYAADRQSIPGRANGGDLKPYSAYQVHDTSSPELAMFANGMSLLLTGQSGGRIAKIVSMAGAPVSGGGGGVLDIAAARDVISKQNKASNKTDTTQKQINKVLSDITDTELDFFQKEYKIRQTARNAELDAEKQLAHDRANTIDDGRQTLLDAIRRGDGASALAAVRNTKKQLDEQSYQFGVQKEQRDRNLDEQLAASAEERKQRLADYAERIQEIKDQSQAEVDQQAAADDAAINEADDTNTILLGNQKQTNSDIKKDSKSTTKSLTDNYASNNRALIGSSDAFAVFVNRITALVGNLTNTAVTAGPQQTQPIIPQSTGNTNPTPGPNVAPPGAPANPYVTQVYKDPTGKLWLWNGRSWQSATSVPGHAQGGSFSPYSAFRVHDTSDMEMMRMNNGQSLVLSGSQGGRVTPLGQNHSGAAGGRGGDTYVTMQYGDIVSNATDPMEVVQLARSVILPDVKDIMDKANAKNDSHNMLEIRRNI